MALSFKIDRQRNAGRLCLKLKGDFDGSSAAELAWMLRSIHARDGRVLIDTGALKSVHPFGRETFRRRYRRAGGPRLTWAGKYAADLSARDEASV